MASNSQKSACLYLPSVGLKVHATTTLFDISLGVLRLHVEVYFLQGWVNQLLHVFFWDLFLTLFTCLTVFSGLGINYKLYKLFH